MTNWRVLTEKLLRLIEESAAICPWCGVFHCSDHHRKDCPVTEARRAIVGLEGCVSTHRGMRCIFVKGHDEYHMGGGLSWRDNDATESNGTEQAPPSSEESKESNR